jgi:hypothetical protein
MGGKLAFWHARRGPPAGLGTSIRVIEAMVPWGALPHAALEMCRGKSGSQASPARSFAPSHPW